MNNWKTTVTGVCLIVAVVASDVAAFLQGHPVDWQTSLAGVVAGVGFLGARDAKKTDLTPHEQVAAKNLVATTTPPANE